MLAYTSMFLSRIYSYSVTGFVTLKEKTRSLYNFFYEQEKKHHHNNVVVAIVSAIYVISAVSKIVFRKVVHSLNKNKTECEYHYKGKQYKIYLPHKKFYLPRIVKAHDTVLNKDLTSLITQYAGPHENFHNTPVTPKQLGIHHPIKLNYMEDHEEKIKEIEPEQLIVI